MLPPEQILAAFMFAADRVPVRGLPGGVQPHFTGIFFAASASVRPVARRFLRTSCPSHLGHDDQLHAAAVPLFVFMGVVLEKSASPRRTAGRRMALLFARCAAASPSRWWWSARSRGVDRHRRRQRHHHGARLAAHDAARAGTTRS